MVCSRLALLLSLCISIFGVHAVENGSAQESFLAQPKKKKKMTTQQIKRSLGDELEQLAHSLLQEINLLTQGEHELLLRISELLNDDVSGLSSSTTAKDLEATLQEVRNYRCLSQQRSKELEKFNKFLVNKRTITQSQQ